MDACPSTLESKPGGIRPSSDRALLERWIREGDECAAEQLANRLLPLAGRITRGMLGAGADATELAQEVVEELLLEAGAISGEPGAWLRTSATRRCLMWLRSRRRRRLVALTGVEEPRAPAEPPEQAAVDPPRLVEQLLAALLPAERELLVRRFLLGQTQGEIASATARSQPAIARRLTMALQRLRGDPRLLAWRDCAA